MANVCNEFLLKKLKGKVPCSDVLAKVQLQRITFDYEGNTVSTREKGAKTKCVELFLLILSIVRS